MDYYPYHSLYSQLSQGFRIQISRYRSVPVAMITFEFGPTTFVDPLSKHYNNRCGFLKESRACENDCYKLGTADCREKCETNEECISCMDEHAKCVSNCPCHSGCPDGCPCRHWPCDVDEKHDDNQILILREFQLSFLVIKPIFRPD